LISLLALASVWSVRLLSSILSLNDKALVSWSCWDGGIVLELPFLFDKFRVIFFFTVNVISGAVFLFALRYIAQERIFVRFHLLLFRFVVSMWLLIFRTNLVRLLLGWDGLGLTSYLLVIYFQTRKSFNAGLITALTNRAGDALLLLAAGLALASGTWNLFLLPSGQVRGAQLLLLCIVLGACTKRAQLPFSAWLPAAIAAPTPVSSLVHSSTLVTAGVYLLFRHSAIIENAPILLILWAIGRATILIAGLAALQETDIKKVVALSTLSQLGVIMVSLGAKLWVIGFFHLICHAFFKALLFLTVGNIIHMSNDYQDIRKTGILHHYAPATLAFSLRANLRLCGLPFRSGFYSKDLCIEASICLRQTYFTSLVFYIATALTAAYTVRLIVLTQRKRISLVMLSRVEKDSFINGSMIVLFPLAIRAGSCSLWVLRTPVSLPLYAQIKNLTLRVILLGSASGFLLASRSTLVIGSREIQGVLSIWTLPLITTRAFTAWVNPWGSLNRCWHDLAWQPRIIFRRVTWSTAPGFNPQPSPASVFISGGLLVRLLFIFFTGTLLYTYV